MIWTIKGQEVIRLGDSTTHGGKVTSASADVFYEGIPVARVGDSVSCPKCIGTHTIVSGAPTAFNQDAPIARNGDRVSCGARLIARSGLGDMPGGSCVSSPDSQSYAEDFQVMLDGLPLRNISYCIFVEGEHNASGNTDDSGRTRLSTGESSKKVDLYLNQSIPPKIA